VRRAVGRASSPLRDAHAGAVADLASHRSARQRNILRLCAAAVALVITSAVSPIWAGAASPNADDGRWYYSATSLAELHERTTGEGITVAVLDGRVNTQVADLAGADVQPHEPSFCAAEPGGPAYPGTSTDADGKHATSMATMLVGQDVGSGGTAGIPGVAPGITLRTYAIIVEGLPCETPAGQENSQDDAFRAAIADGADIIAVPGANNFSSTVIVEALRAGAIIVAAGGNEGFLGGLPATYNGVLSMGTVTPDVTLAEGNPGDELLGAVAPGANIRSLNGTYDGYVTTTGSSNATAYAAGALAMLWSLYPDVSANQILQAAVHTTDGQVKDTPAHDFGWGYGTVSPSALMSVDPSTYPDENPFLVDDADRSPTAAEVLSSADQAAPDGGVAADDAAPDDDAASATEQQRPSLAPPVAVAAAIVVALTALVAALRRRRSG
jgi:hypothetical protein